MIKLMSNYPIATALIVLFAVGSIAYYFLVVRWERKEAKKNKEKNTAPYFDIKKFRELNKRNES